MTEPDPASLFDPEPASADADSVAAERTRSKLSRVQGWRRVFRGNRTLWIVAGVAVLSLVGGLLVGRFIVSPADAAAGAQAPDAGLITVPVELGELSNDVTLRGDVGYADAVEVKIDAAGIGGPAVVTGQVPAVGAIFSPLSVALEVSGRPVIVLPGDLPAYRTLRAGVSGPDVVQLKQALAAVGIDGGDPASPVFDATTAAGVVALYAAVGYAPPAAAEGTEEAVAAAAESVRAADKDIRAAKDDLARAKNGPSAVEVLQADNSVASARRALATAQAQQPPDPDKIADLTDAVNLEVAKRQQLAAPPDTASQAAAVDAARARYDAAVVAQGKAQEDALTSLPVSEVLFLNQLPRRVDSVAAGRGTVLSGAAMTVSGADVRVSATAAEADAKLLTVGDAATFEMPDGSMQAATVSLIAPPGSTPASGSGSGSAGSGGSGSGGSGSGSSTRWTITLQPAPLTPEQITALQGQNVRVSIPVGATQGAVLAVPLAALTAGPGGESRVEVVDGDPKDGADAETRLVTVETGLAAGRLVEVTPVDGGLEEGDLVVVGE